MNKSKEPKEERQSVALEFMFTYAWAILVVLDMIGALAYFGVISPDRFLPNQDKGNCQIVEYKAFMTPYTCNQMGQALLLDISLPEIKVMQNKICTNLNVTTNITQDISYGGYNNVAVEKMFLENCLLKLT